MEFVGFFKLSNKDSYFFFTPRESVLFLVDTGTRFW